MIASIPKSYEDHYHLNNDDVQGYSQSMSKHHQSQYSRIGDAPEQMMMHYPYNSAQPNFHPPLPHHAPPHSTAPIHQDYYYEPAAPAAPAPAPANLSFSPMGYDAQIPPEYPGFGGYMNPNHSASQFSHTSSLSSPSLEHPALGVSHSFVGSLPSPYSKDAPDMLAAMRNRTHSWSARSSRKSRAFSYDGKWAMPYEPQMGLNYSTTGPNPENDQLVSPLVGSIDEHYDAAVAAGERMRANSHPPYLYAGVVDAASAASAAAAVGAGAASAVNATPRPRSPHDSSYAGSPNSDTDCYSPTTKSNNDLDDRRNKKSATCPVCNKVLKRDLTRHMRTHEETARFICPFPRSQCPHKRGQFNRPYDYKKHLLHHHFQFDKAKVVRRFRDLQSKLGCLGSCPCGQGNFTANEWLNNHILGGQICPLVQAQSQEPEA